MRPVEISSGAYNERNTTPSFNLDTTGVIRGLLVGGDEDAAPGPSAADSPLRHRIKPALPAGKPE